MKIMDHKLTFCPIILSLNVKFLLMIYLITYINCCSSIFCLKKSICEGARASKVFLNLFCRETAVSKTLTIKNWRLATHVSRTRRGVSANGPRRVLPRVLILWPPSFMIILELGPIFRFGRHVSEGSNVFSDMMKVIELNERRLAAKLLVFA